MSLRKLMTRAVLGTSATVVTYRKAETDEYVVRVVIPGHETGDGPGHETGDGAYTDSREDADGIARATVDAIARLVSEGRSDAQIAAWDRGEVLPSPVAQAALKYAPAVRLHQGFEIGTTERYMVSNAAGRNYYRTLGEAVSQAQDRAIRFPQHGPAVLSLVGEGDAATEITRYLATDDADGYSVVVEIGGAR